MRLLRLLQTAALAALLLPALAWRSSPQVTETPADPLPVMTPASHALPFLWFRNDAEAALRFYATVFPEAEVLDEVRWSEGGPVPAGTLMSASLRIAGQTFMILSGGPAPAFNDSFSIFLRADSQADIDRLWSRLTADGGQPGPCGWLKDKHGLSWQVVPGRLLTMLRDPDGAKVKRVGAALMRMQKIDLAGLEQAYAGR